MSELEKRRTAVGALRFVGVRLRICLICLLAVVVGLITGCGEATHPSATTIATSVSTRTATSTPSASPTSPGSGEGFELIVLRQEEYELLYDDHEIEDSWAVLSKVSLSDPALTIRTGDIKEYDWGRQGIILTPAASKAFAAAFPRTGLSQSLAEDVGERCFVVMLGGTRLYGGVFLEPWTDLGINYPVIYASGAETEVVLEIRPKHVPWWRYQDFPEAMRATIEIEAIHDYFEAQGKLTEWESAPTRRQ